MLVRRAVAALVLVVSAGAGCKGEAEPSPSEALGSASSSASPAPQRIGAGDVVTKAEVAERAAFDLFPAGEDAALAYATPAGRVRAQRLTADGKAGKAVDVAGVEASSRVVEVSGAAGGGRIAVAWIEQGGHGVLARVALGDADTLSFGDPFDLGPATLSTTDRGHLSVAALGGDQALSGEHRFVVFHRGPKEACDEAPSGCVTFPLHQVDEAGVQRRRVALSVPAPCGRGVAGFATAGERWYYGVCALTDGRSTTTMFTIEHAPEYAQAESVLPGCVPVDTAVVGGEALLVGQCGRDRRAVRLGRREAAVSAIGLADLQITCANGIPRLAASGPGGLSANLSETTGPIGALLPASIAPRDARALWTGKALLVAAPALRDVSVRVFRCLAA